MLKDIVDKYTVSNEDSEEDTKLDEVKDVEETETEETDVEETREDETQTEQSEEAEEAEADDTNDELATEEAEGDTTVLEAPTDEQGEVTTAETEEVVSEVTPEADVVEAGDDIGQETPEESFDGISDKEDITAGSDEDLPLDGAVAQVITDGEEVARAQTEIVEQATVTAGEIEGGTAPTDVNGNAITEEEAEVNIEEEKIDKEIEEEAAEEVTATDVVEPETPAEEATALAEELADEVKDEAEDSTDDSLGEDDTASGDDFADTDTSDSTSGDLGDETTDDTFDDDDVPLEGAESTTEEDTESTDVTEEVSEESTDSELPDGDTPDTEVTEGDTTDVQESVDDQNLAADLTAEAASSDANQTEDLKGDTTVKDSIDTIPVDATADDAEPLEVDVTDTFKDKEVDGNPDYSDNHQDDTAPTVQETIDNPDGTEESLAKDLSDDAVTHNDDLEASVTEDEAEETDTSVGDDAVDPTTDASDGIADVEQTSQVGADGEIEDVTPEADFAEGEIDIPDVDDETTDDEVAEAEVEADDEEVKADYDEQLAEDAGKTVEELQNEAASLEHLITKLTTGITNEKYDPRVVSDSYIAVDRLKAAFGDTVNTITLEDYTRNDLDLAYVASLESVRGALSRVTRLTTRLNDQLSKWWARPMVTKVVKRSEALNKAVDKALVDLKAAEFTGGDVSGISGYLSTNESSLIKAVADDLKTTTGISTKGLAANEKLIDNLVRALDDIIAAKTPESIGTILKQVSGIKSTKAAYPNEAFKKGLLMGNWKLDTKEGSIGLSGIPVAVKETSGDRKTSFKLVRSDLSSLLVMAKTYAALARKVAETTGDKAVEAIPSLGHQRARALPVGTSGRIHASAEEDKKVDELATDLSKAAKAHHDIYKFVVKHALDMSDALIAVVYKAI